MNEVPFDDLGGSTVRKVMRYPGTFSFTVLAFLLAALPGVWMLIEPQYRAEGKIRIGSVILRLAFVTDDNGAIPYYEYYAASQPDRVRSPEVLQRVLENPQVRQTEWFHRRLRGSGKPGYDQMLKALDVLYKPRTEVIEVAFTCSRGNDSAAVVNAVMEEFVNCSRLASDRLHDKVYQKLQEQYDAIDNEIHEQRNVSVVAVSGSQSPETTRLLSLRESLKTRLDQKNIERAAPPNIEILAKAYPPHTPSTDRRRKLTLAVILAAFASGLTLAYVRGVCDPVVYEPSRLGGPAGFPVLGRIPCVPSHRGLTEFQSVTLHEGYRRLRTRLLKAIENQSHAVVMITGAEPGVGKTSVAIMLAKCLARHEKKILLIDANLRHPSVGSCFRISRPSGLTDLLTRSEQVGGIVKTDNSYLDLLPAGQPIGIDFDQLGGQTFRQCLERWRNDYEIILIDTPALETAADAAVLCPLADLTLAVVREGFSRFAETVETLRLLTGCTTNRPSVVYIGNYRLDEELLHDKNLRA